MNVKFMVWGRVNLVNVQKVFWCFIEFDFVYECIDVGMSFGCMCEVDYFVMNFNVWILILVDGDFVLWEFNLIMCYFCLVYGWGMLIYLQMLQQCVLVDCWFDWMLLMVQFVDCLVFWGIVWILLVECDMIQVQCDVDFVVEVWIIVDCLFLLCCFFEGD